MPDFSAFLETYANALSWAPLIAVAVGLVIGITLGMLPGMGPLLGVTLAIPFTFDMDPVSGVALLMGIYQGGSYGGAITAILLGIPGTPIAAATLLDGHPMARAGRASEAITLATLASWIGGIISGIVLLFTAPALASIALQFGPAEIFALALFGLTAIATLSEGAAVAGLLAGIFGLLLATVGTDHYTGITRFNFGMTELSGGITFVALLVGLFAISEVLLQIERPFKTSDAAGKIGFHFASMKTLLKRSGSYIRSSLIGVLIGIVPGVGGVVSSFLSYKITKDISRDRENFGKGDPRGIIATEAANSATTGGALVPMLAIGIPGDPIVAVMMGGLLVHGLTPGPTLFFTNIEVLDGIFLIFIIGAILLLPLGLFLVPVFARILRIPHAILITIVAMLAFYGTYAVNNRIFDLWTMWVFGLLGYLMRKARIPLAPMVIGFVLGPVVEVQLRRMSAMAGDDIFGYLAARPIAACILVAAFLALVFPVLLSRFRLRSR
jgi:putative tricarboxylic transport membrane protein